jgi:hypothetical protein
LTALAGRIDFAFFKKKDVRQEINYQRKRFSTERMHRNRRIKRDTDKLKAIRSENIFAFNKF